MFAAGPSRRFVTKAGRSAWTGPMPKGRCDANDPFRTSRDQLDYALSRLPRGSGRSRGVRYPGPNLECSLGHWARRTTFVQSSPPMWLATAASWPDEEGTLWPSPRACSAMGILARDRRQEGANALPEIRRTIGGPRRLVDKGAATELVERQGRVNSARMVKIAVDKTV